MKCPVCEKGSLKRQKVGVEKFGVSVGTYAADVCSACGEQIFGPKEAAEIEARIMQLGLWGAPVPSRIYKVGGNFVVSIKKKVALALGIDKPVEVTLIPQVKNKRFVVEIAHG
ncbi:MAG: YgiT-type zinc finger protein [Candidatus Micrarchaeota archaeon]